MYFADLTELTGLVLHGTAVLGNTPSFLCLLKLPSFLFMELHTFFLRLKCSTLYRVIRSTS